MKQQQKNSLIITLKDALGALDDDAFFTDQLAHGLQGFERGLPTRNVLQEGGDIVKMFENLLVFDYLDVGPTASEALNYCHKMGWVHADQRSCTKGLQMAHWRNEENIPPMTIRVLDYSITKSHFIHRLAYFSFWFET